MSDKTCASLSLDPQIKADARRRLLSVRGHVDGVVRMLERDEIYCVDVLKQVSAIEGALRKVSNLVLRSHLHSHVVTSQQRGDTETIVSELMEVLKYHR